MDVLQIDSIPVTKMQVEELRGYLLHVDEEVIEMKPSVVGDTPAYMPAVLAFESAYGNFAEALKDPASVATSQLATAADLARDEAWSGSYFYLKGMAKHPTPELAALGTKLLDIYNKYGNPSSLSRNKETGILSDLLEDLEAVPADERTKLSFDIWLSNLKEKHLAYIAAVKERTEQKRQREVGIIQETRKAVEAAYTDMIDMFNALIRVEGEEKYADFAGRINVLIAEQKTELRRRDTLNKKKNEGETPVV